MNATEPDPTLARPTAAEWRAFAARLLHAAGLGALGAGVIFFVAANWQAWGLLGRFGLLEAGLLICIGAALWRPAPQRVGQAALLLATLVTGGLLALFGQSYQTGADVHELFFTWALLALPFALAALSGAVWAVWWVVLNVGLGLLCGGLGLDHFFWRVIDGWGWDRATLLMLPCLANLFGAGVFMVITRNRRAAPRFLDPLGGRAGRSPALGAPGSTRFADAAPLWLLRLLLTLGLGYGTAASLPHGADSGATVPMLFAAISVGIAVATWMRRQDVFPLTALAGSWITVSTAWLAHSMRLNDLGEFFVIAMWLIASSTLTGMLLMHWLRQWRASGAEGVAS